MEAVVKWTFVASFLDLFAVSLLLPLMSARLKELGASHFLMGCMTSVYALTQLVSGPIVGSWSDRIGRQQILFFSMIVVGCCYSLLGLLHSLLLILLLRTILGIFKHTQVLLRTIVVDRVAGDQLTTIFGYMKAVAGLSFTLGPAIGGNLAELENGFSHICYCVGALFALNSAVVYLFLNDLVVPETGSDASDAKKKSEKFGGSIMDAIRDLINIDWTVFWDVFALKFLTDFSIGAFHNNYSIKLSEKFGVSPKIAGYTISLQSFVGVLAAFFVDRFNVKFYTDDFSYKKRIFHSYAIMTIAYLGIAATGNIAIFMMWAILLKSVHMFLRLVMTEMTIKRCPSDQRGSIMGTGNSVSNTARLITPLLTGFVEDLWGSNSSNILAAIAGISGILVSMRLREYRRKNS